ncbi:MAG: cytochrome b N-terminal domain-containing protein [Planctomycetota bacterium]|nr:cytochrome b N-terminal domain-containing protein [Planctomycetota bacterium]
MSGGDGFFARLFRTWLPRTPRESSEAVVRNIWLHAFPARITKRSLSWLASGWLGTVSLHLFIILSLTGVVLMFLYVPSVERAYASVKDIEFVVSFGSWIRGTHRIAAHLMVVVVVLHLVRVFLTGAYKKEGAPGAHRPLNWLVGLVLLVLTFALSFTGYLLPWDQLAYWAVTVGTQIAAAAPLVGEELRQLLLGGTVVGQPTLLRFYVLHCFALPLLTVFLVAWHMWRIRKDGGLAVADRVADDAREQAAITPPPPGKTYTLMGATQGGTVQAASSTGQLENATTPGVPAIPRRSTAVFLAVLALCSVLGLLLQAPLEEPANPAVTPNPAKAPWYFLWLQELVSILTFRIGDFVVDGSFLGGILVPGLLIGLLAAWPYLDKSPAAAAGIWFHPSRKVQNRVFLLLLFACVVLTIIGTYFRGPYWAWTWPWADAHPHTTLT